MILGLLAGEAGEVSVVCLNYTYQHVVQFV